MLGFNSDRAEEDVSDDLAIQNSDERNVRVSVPSKSVHEIGFVGLTEGELVHAVN